MKNILVTIDFNENEKLLIDKAFQLAEPFDSKIWLIHIAAPDPDFIGYKVGPQYIRDSRASDLKKGLKIEIDGDPCMITNFEFSKPGKGQALYRCKIKNLTLLKFSEAKSISRISPY